MLTHGCTIRHTFLRYAVLSILVILSGIPSPAAEPPQVYEATDHLSIRTINVDQGLVSTWVNAVMQDRDGFIWLACWGGVARFDGTSLVNYSYDEGLPASSLCSALLQLSDGTMICSVAFEGFFYLEDSRWYPLQMPDSFARPAVSGMFQDDDGQVWLATGDGVWRGRIEAGSFTGSPVVFDGQLVLYVGRDARGRVWAGSDNAVGVLENGTWTIIPIEELDMVIRCVGVLAEDDTAWITTTNGLYRYDAMEKTVELVFQPQPDTRCRSIIRDDSGSLILTTRIGMYVHREDAWNHYGLENGLSATNLIYLFRDSFDNLWIPTRTNGVMIVGPRKFQNYIQFGSDSGRYVTAVLEETDGTRWIGTETGLFVQRGSRWSPVALSARPPASSIYGIFRCRDGCVLVTGFQRLDRIRNGRCEDLKETLGLPDATFLAPVEDERGRVWICTINSGLIVLDGDRWEQVDVSDGTPLSGAVYCSHKSWNGNIWFGTYDGRIFRLVNGMPRLVEWSRELPDTAINALYEDPEGRLWVGTAGAGLYMQHEDGLRHFGKSSGFPASVCTVLSAIDDRILVGTNMGLVAGDGNSWTLYDQRDGLPGIEFQNGAMQQLPDGRVLMGTDKGLTVIDRTRLSDLPGPVETRVLGAWNNEISLLGETTGISSAHSEVMFEFVGLEYRSPSKLRYRYRLEPGDPSWHETTERRVHYRSLQPGDYRFAVQSAYGSERWGPEAVFAFSVAPAFWQTSWFMILATLGLAMLGSMAVKGTRAGFNRLLMYHQRNWFAHFRLRGVLGSGGMAIVYEASNRKTGARVALKVLRTGILAGENEKRFLREGTLSAQLSLDNVVRVMDYGVHNHTPWLEMELVKGITLTELKNRGELGIQEACCITRSLLQIVSGIHAAKVLHRDLKPDNIMVSGLPEREPEHTVEEFCSSIGSKMKILDFGISRYLDASTTTRLEMESGTPIFRPPETFFGEGRNTESIDIYAVGMIFYFLLTGTYPYDVNEEPSNAIGSILYRDPVPVSAHNASIPEPIVHLVMKMVAKDPEARVTDLAVIMEQLTAAVAVLSGKAMQDGVS